MFDRGFSHYLTYGATDQHTIVELSQIIDGVIVPATVAAFQKDGTGGFVLSLSARESAPDYVIDPRFPLYQQALRGSERKPKKSHLMLSELLEDEGLVQASDPSPNDFDDKRLAGIAKKWVEFNLGYTEVDAKFQKYAERLGERILPQDAKTPKYIIAPYFMASGVEDPWWERSQRFFELTKEAVGSDSECLRVVAVKSADALPDAIESISEERIGLWVNDLHELTTDPADLAGYLRGIRAASASEISVFALYGGFFSVIASKVGLNGSCHGIGFGEHRKWVELPSSGPAPARYYSPALHRYVSQEDAYQLWRIDEEFFGCQCAECKGQNPLRLDYHELMKHSVRCRAEEISNWRQFRLDEISAKLKEQYARFIETVESANIAERDKDRLLRLPRHLPNWFRAVDEIG
ncbi:MAG: hypothetical protein GVY30_00025 [Chloroflexi bacterium]|jgi:hypothetical protein|nr:hypothetical protein [Chloroflexota bacterium]